jgi:hypothetical protein
MPKPIHTQMMIKEVDSDGRGQIHFSEYCTRRLHAHTYVDIQTAIQTDRRAETERERERERERKKIGRKTPKLLFQYI